MRVKTSQIWRHGYGRGWAARSAQGVSTVLRTATQGRDQRWFNVALRIHKKYIFIPETMYPNMQHQIGDCSVEVRVQVYCMNHVQHRYPKYITMCITFIHSLTHSNRGNYVRQRHQPAHQEQLGLQCLSQGHRDVQRMLKVPGVEIP